MPCYLKHIKLNYCSFQIMVDKGLILNQCFRSESVFLFTALQIHVLFLQQQLFHPCMTSVPYIFTIRHADAYSDTILRMPMTIPRLTDAHFRGNLCKCHGQVCRLFQTTPANTVSMSYKNTLWILHMWLGLFNRLFLIFGTVSNSTVTTVTIANFS